jgi:RPA family protein
MRQLSESGRLTVDSRAGKLDRCEPEAVAFTRDGNLAVDLLASIREGERICWSYFNNNELMNRITQIKKNRAIVDWMDTWSKSGDIEEQSEALQYLIDHIDESRASNRKIFP